jgi:Rod binding domain-containing protein
MKPVPGVAAAASAAPINERAELRKLSQDLEGVFVRQLIAAMRESVPKEDGLGSAGQELFTNLFDDALAKLVAERMQRGMSEALYRQLARGLAPTGGDTTTK